MLRTRLANLRTAALVAAGFVALRVVYRVVFGGGSGNGVLLADLPRVPLGGPFSSVILLGPITTGGLVSAALSALPFAAVILAVGLIGVVVDLRALLTRGTVRGPFRTVSRALAIAWSTFPALRDSVLRVRVARELRGERSSASLIVPVLEQTVERAIALGASLEVRGFAATRHPDPDTTRPVIMTDAALGFDGRWVLEAVDLRLDPGTLTLVTGPTGSGKSTLLQALSGIFQHQLAGEQIGGITVGGVDRMTTPPRETASFVSVVSQSVRLSFVASTVAEEVGFALAVRGTAPSIVQARVAEVAATLGIAHLLEREIGALSAGEACLVAIGAALVSRPVLLIVDEPLADLDTAARARVVGVLDRLAHQTGVCVVVAEHAIRAWDGVVDDRLDLHDGVLRSGAGRTSESEAVSSDRVPTTPEEVVVRVHGLTVRIGQGIAVDDATFSLLAGQIAALQGPNGAGKSSLLHALARPADRGRVFVRGIDVRTLRRAERRRSVALVPEAFDDLLFTTTVEEECRRADRRAEASDRGVSSAAATFLRFLGIEDADASRRLLAHHPRDLSAGERLCLVIAIQLSARPSALLVDEPTRGLDARARSLVGGALRTAAEAGTTVLLATHDLDFAERWADRTLTMTAGRLDELAEVRR